MSIFKDTFIDSVQTQLKRRQDALISRTPDSIRYLNSRNAWIKMSSSVNVDGLNDVASLNVLKGGILSPFGLKSGVGDDAAYSRFTPNGEPNLRGLRPMPGITSIDIKSKSAYGSLREVNVNFQCWDIKQLEDLELLYMRPGYTVLIEWGWLPYLNNQGVLQHNLEGGTYDIIKQTPSKETIWKDLFDKSKALGGNYDAMFGYVKNYSWSARPDGGYDCVTTIISIGEIIESLKTNYAPLTINLNKTSLGLLKVKPIGTEVEKKYKKNILAGLFAEMYKLAIENENNSNLDDKGKKYFIVDKNNNNTTYDFFLRKVEIKNSVDDENKTIGEGANKNHVYIKLKSLIDILNKYVILADSRKNESKPLIELSLKERTYDKSKGPNNEEPPLKDLLCLSHPLQISVDPTICLIGNDLWANIKKPEVPATDVTQTIQTAASTFISSLSAGLSIGNASTVATNVASAPSQAEEIADSLDSIQYLKNLDSYFFDSTKNLGVIGNIYINLQFLYGLSLDNNLESQDKKEKQEISVYDFIKNVTSQISNCIGNVNNFDIHVDPIDNKARIIDINYADEKKKVDVYNNAFTLEMHNLKSTIRSYKLESQIFPEQSTIVAIGAQVQGGALGTDSNTMSGFNRNITDRIIPAKKDPNVTQKTTEEETRKEELANLQENIKTLYEFFGDKTGLYIFWSQASYDVNRAGEYKGALRDLIKGFQSITKDKNKYNAIIPTKLSFEMDGIGGLVIGHIFKIPDYLLPKGYKGVTLNSNNNPSQSTEQKPTGHRLGYIVTGIGHKIQNNDWVTNVDSQTIVLDDPTDGIEVDYSVLLQIVSEALAKGGTVDDVIGNGTDGISPNEIIKRIYEPALSNVNTTEGLKTLMEAHTIIEGFIPGTRAYRNNNPGNLAMSDKLKAFGAVLEPANAKGEREFAKFPTLEKGIEAKLNYINRIIKGEHKLYPTDPTLETYITIYAPPSRNDTKGYIRKIISFFAKRGASINKNTKLSEIKNIQFSSLLRKDTTPYQSITKKFGM